MTLAIKKRSGRPSWMTPSGHEGFGDAFFDRLWPEWRRDMGGESIPSVNFYEKDWEYHLTAEIPGLKKEDISVSFDHNRLTISGKRESEKEEEGKYFYVKETSTGSFSRSFTLPREVDEEKIEATYKDGVLTLKMPIRETSKTKKIKVH